MADKKNKPVEKIAKKGKKLGSKKTLAKAQTLAAHLSTRVYM